MPFKIVIVFFSAVISIGCSSNNIRTFKPDSDQSLMIKQKLSKKISRVNVAMIDGDTDHILCRMVGNIYLPNRMKYSEYIQNALEKTLRSAEMLDNSTNNQELNIKLTKVDFSSTSGRWYINSEVIVGNNQPIIINSESRFGTSFDGLTACKNVAESFDEAIANYIDSVLNKDIIIAQLNSPTNA